MRGFALDRPEKKTLFGHALKKGRHLFLVPVGSFRHGVGRLEHHAQIEKHPGLFFREEFLQDLQLNTRFGGRKSDGILIQLLSQLGEDIILHGDLQGKNRIWTALDGSHVSATARMNCVTTAD